MGKSKKCPGCKGKGYRWCVIWPMAGKYKCPTCKGTGVNNEEG